MPAATTASAAPASTVTALARAPSPNQSFAQHHRQIARQHRPSSTAISRWGANRQTASPGATPTQAVIRPKIPLPRCR